MEFYDFALYGYLSIYIKSNFFIVGEGYFQYLMLWGTFLAGYLSRPAGAIFFGYLADNFGRRKSLLVSVFLMTLSTFFIGILPGYEKLGLLSPCLLLLFRIVQGFSVSGEEGTVVVYLSEIFRKKAVGGLISAWILVSILLGVLLGSLVCFFVKSVFLEEQMLSFGWRIPYLLSVILGVIAFLFRLNSSETDDFLKNKKEILEKKYSFFSFFMKNLRSFSYLFLLPIVFAIPISINIVFIPNFLSTINSVDYVDPLLVNAFGIICICSFSFLVGKLSEKIGYRETILLGSALLMILGYPISFLIQLNDVFYILTAQVLLSLTIAVTSAPLFIMMANEFPVSYRCTGFSLVFNSGMAVFAGTTPLIIDFFYNYSFGKSFFGFYLIFSGLIGVLVLRNFKKKIFFKQQDFQYECL